MGTWYTKRILALFVLSLGLPTAIAFTWDNVSHIRDDLLAGDRLVFVPHGGWSDAIVPVALLAILAFVVREVRRAGTQVQPMPPFSARASKILTIAALTSCLLGFVVVCAGDLLMVPAVASLVIERNGYLRCPALDSFVSRSKTHMAVWAPTRCPDAVTPMPRQR